MNQMTYTLPLQTATIESKRLVLAFESRAPREVMNALNSLLLFSVNTDEPFYLERHPFLLDSLYGYFELMHRKLMEEAENMFRPMQQFEF